MVSFHLEGSAFFVMYEALVLLEVGLVILDEEVHRGVPIVVAEDLAGRQGLVAGTTALFAVALRRRLRRFRRRGGSALLQVFWAIFLTARIVALVLRRAMPPPGWAGCRCCR
jgi:hypothetical protein